MNAHVRSYFTAPWDFWACDLCKQGYRQSSEEATNAQRPAMATRRVVDETARFTPVGHQAGAQKALGFK